MDIPTLRVARPSENIAALKPVYRDGLGLDVPCDFADHDGFDGIMFGKTGAPYHFEIARNPDHGGRPPSRDNLLGFHLRVLSAR